MFEKTGEDYLRWYYDTQIWKQIYYRGVRTLKSVSDLWNYQEIICERKVEWVLEMGTRHGGATLFFADLLTAENAPGQVISVDCAPQLDEKVKHHPKIIFLQGDSTSPEVVTKVVSCLPPLSERGRLFLILDSDHGKQHVLKELMVYVPLLKTGDYLVVEDTCINGHPVRPDFGPGPMEAVQEFIQSNPSLLIYDVVREQKFGFTFAPSGFYIKANAQG